VATPFPSELPAEPVADLWLTEIVETEHTACHLSIAEEGLDGDNRIGANSGPVIHEGISIGRIPGRTGHHEVGLWTQLLLEEARQILVGYATQHSINSNAIQ
jgi:hypothetical protein